LFRDYRLHRDATTKVKKIAFTVTFPRLAQWGILENKIVNQHEFTIEAQSFNEPL
jgi:hypothetical protein